MGNNRYRPRALVPAEERFWKKVNKTEDCWLWLGHLQRYGRFKPQGIRNSPQVLAHRYSYELHFGPIPIGMNVLHKCDNPACVNPDHLFLGTQKDNVIDMMNKGRGSIHIASLYRWKNHKNAGNETC
jgi:hypothetical protein